MKLLTVDDSKTVRIIVRKAFKSYDLDILEACNGVEGLSVASREEPDVILLDVTMPVMDGVEMLTKLKSDPKLKSIPVLMLTAEGGRDTVIKIAKIGVRDYIVKPFKEDVLLDKIGRIIDLRLLGEEDLIRRTILDPAKIVAVEDKPAIVKQIVEGLQDTPWTIQESNNTWTAIDYAQNNPVDLFLISLNLPDEASFELFRLLRSNRKTKSVPILGMVVKTDTDRLHKAQQMGFTALISKPLDINELESKIARAMDLDMAPRYFRIEKDYMVVRFPATPSGIDLTEIASNLNRMLTEAVDQGLKKIVLDMQQLKSLEVGIIKQVLTIMQSCRELSLEHMLIGNPEIISEGKSFEETQNWKFFDSMDAVNLSLAAS